MAVKKRYHHSMAVDQGMEEKIDKVRQAGYSLPQIVSVGLDEMLKVIGRKGVAPAKKEDF